MGIDETTSLLINAEINLRFCYTIALTYLKRKTSLICDIELSLADGVSCSL